MRVSLLLLLLCVLTTAYQVHGDKIINLPGVNGTLNFQQYSGYINVNPATGRNLFYWLTESQNNPSKDPLVLWLNGGPGCSSLGGFFEELGPFRPNADGKTLSLNPFSWNTAANVIFLDSPSGVGFSYSDNTSDYHVGDARTANDTYNFLLGFLKEFPQYASSPFYVTGESYAGHYAPDLVKRILEGNKGKNNETKIQLKGMMVGNPLTDLAIDNYGTIFFWWTHALISDETFEGLSMYCNISSNIGSRDESKCNKYEDQAAAEMGNIDAYDIYADVCIKEKTRALSRHLGRSNAPLAGFYRALDDKDEPTPPCIDSYLKQYLNQASVKSAIHAKSSIKWKDCDDIDYIQSDVALSLIPTYQYIIADGSVRILVYTGDVDSVVPVTGTREILKVLNLPELKSWYPWIGSSKQVGGYATVYKGLTYATVRGAGHLVPSYEPQRALDLFTRFLKNVDI